MNEKEKSETIGHLSELLRSTTDKRLVFKDTRTTEAIISDFKDGVGFCTQPEIEYFNTVFSPEEVNTLKRKLLKLVEEL